VHVLERDTCACDTKGFFASFYFLKGAKVMKKTGKERRNEDDTKVSHAFFNGGKESCEDLWKPAKIF
jgi:hypothetical protein